MEKKHFIYSSDIDKNGYDEILRRTKKFIKEGISPELCRGKIVANMFFQPSTRTMMAFQTGMMRAGGSSVTILGEQGLSMEKGESFEDTIRTFSEFVDCIVLRHSDEDSAERARDASHVSVVNGGSGSKEHAVGAAMMLAGWAHHLGNKSLQGLKVGLYGTPEINRVCKALIPVMGLYGMELIVDDLGGFPVPEEIAERAMKNGLKSLTYDKLDNFIGEVDILLVTRGLQKGIIPADKFPKEREEFILKAYKPITTEHMKKLRPDAFLSMITPRIFEIEKDVDADPRATYAQKEPFSEVGLAVMTYLLGIDV
jgi:aspartate carbamoyltransferase catalytic subunit